MSLPSLLKKIESVVTQLFNKSVIEKSMLIKNFIHLSNIRLISGSILIFNIRLILQIV